MTTTLRPLTADELDLISGGLYIPGYGWVVEGGGGGGGSPFPGGFPGFYPGGGVPSGGGFGGGSGGGSPASSVTHLSSGNDLTNNVHRDLTTQEQVALDHFKAAVADGYNAFSYLNKDQKVHLDDGTAKGRDVKASELANLFQKSDFVINEIGTSYKNGTTRGESDYHGGNPIISLNIDILVGYDLAENGKGMNYLPLHELGHLSGAARDQNQRANADGVYSESERLIQEKMANDTAYAIEVGGHLAPMERPGDGYSTNHGIFR